MERRGISRRFQRFSPSFLCDVQTEATTRQESPLSPRSSGSRLKNENVHVHLIPHRAEREPIARTSVHRPLSRDFTPAPPHQPSLHPLLCFDFDSRLILPRTQYCVSPLIYEFQRHSFVAGYVTKKQVDIFVCKVFHQNFLLSFSNHSYSFVGHSLTVNVRPRSRFIV